MPLRPRLPEPRDAKRGNFAVATRYLPVTVCLIVISVLVGMLTQVGKAPAKADALYMSSQQSFQKFETLRGEYQEKLEKLGFVPEDGRFERAAGQEPVAAGQLRELTAMAKELRLAMERLQDPLADIKGGQVWRLATPMFLHFGYLHIIFNMMWLWQFGVVLEMRFRPLRFLALVLTIAVLSNLAQGLWSGTNFGGMSGVNYGLFGFLLLRSKLHPSPEFVLHPNTVAMMLIWLVVCFSGAVGHVANTAHLVGFVVGGAIGAANAMTDGGWQIAKRRQHFRAAMAASADCLHRCTTCGATERSAPDMDFFVSQRDHQEYCSTHLPENQE